MACRLTLLRVVVLMLVVPLSSHAQIGGKTAADGPFLLDDVEDLDTVAIGVMRTWVSDYIAPQGDVLSVVQLTGSGLTRATDQSPIGAFRASVPSSSKYVSGGFGVPVPAVAGASTATHPGNITSFTHLTFLACFEQTLANQKFQVILETYPGPTYPKIYWNFSPPQGKTFGPVSINLRAPAFIENAGDLTLEQLLAQTRFLYFYCYGGPTSVPRTVVLHVDDIYLTGSAGAATATPTATATATSTATPTSTALADLDQDGLADHLEGWPPVAGQTNRLLPDSDGDGLLDGQEDANRNGQRDSGETDARHKDSDGDGLMDGIEVLITLTGPLNASSPASYSDADTDGLPLPHDPNDAVRDADADRMSDGYEAAKLGLAAVSDVAARPPLADVNLDQFISNVDALIIQSLFLGNVGPTSPIFGGGGFGNADPNRDGFVSNVDALIVQSFFLTNLALLPL